MSLLIQIASPGTYSGFCNILFISLSLLGGFISILFLVRDRFRGKNRTLLGLYTASLSILLLHLAFPENPLKYLNDCIFYAGLVQLFLIGPFSYFLFRAHVQHRQTVGMAYHLLPAGLVCICAAIWPLSSSLWYLLGMVHTGVYLSVQLFRGSVKSAPHYRHTLIQWALYLCIGITCLSTPAGIHGFIASAGLSFLILMIWIRLLYAAYLSYLISKS